MVGNWPTVCPEPLLGKDIKMMLRTNAQCCLSCPNQSWDVYCCWLYELQAQLLQNPMLAVVLFLFLVSLFYSCLRVFVSICFCNILSCSCISTFSCSRRFWCFSPDWPAHRGCGVTESACSLPQLAWRCFFTRSFLFTGNGGSSPSAAQHCPRADVPFTAGAIVASALLSRCSCACYCRDHDDVAS